MVPVLVRPSVAPDADKRATWAFYGARQILDMMGLSYRVASLADAADTDIIIDPARGQICVRCMPCGEERDDSITPQLRVEFQARFEPDPLGMLGGVRGSLPLIGGLAEFAPEGATGCGLASCAVDTYAEEGPIVWVEQVAGDGMRIWFDAPLFETIGLYLSRYSWKGNPGFTRFVKYIDVLWAGLQPRWGAVPVVAEYQRVFEGILGACYAKLDLPLVTKWYHPAIDGQVMRNGLLLSHDVDSVYKSPEFRGRDDQTGNAHWNFDRWEDVENALGVKSAFYLFSPSPDHTYWLQRPNYLLCDRVVLEAALKLAEKGWEIGPHCLGHETAEEVASEIQYFTQLTGLIPPGTRNHYLKHKPASLKYKADAGLRYDSTWYAEQTNSSFLCGTVLPHAPLDAASGDHADIWEFAFVVEDGIVMGCYGSNHARTTVEAIEEGRVCVDQIIARNGYVCLNWHQRTFDRMSADERSAAERWVVTYQGLIAYYQRTAVAWWNPLPGQLADFWSRRNDVFVESSRGDVSVSNTGAGDAGDIVVRIHGSDVGRELVHVPLGPGECRTIALDM